MKNTEIIDAMRSPMDLAIPPRLAAGLRSIAAQNTNGLAVNNKHDLADTDKIALGYLAGCVVSSLSTFLLGFEDEEEAQNWLLEE